MKTTFSKKMFWIAFSMGCCSLFLMNCANEPSSGGTTPTNCENRYPDFEGNIPPGYDSAQLYKLGQNWPKTLPALTKAEKPWENFDEINDSTVTKYLMEMRNMVYDQLAAKDFRMGEGGADWFTIPYQPREALRGMYDGNNQDPFDYDTLQTIEAVNFTTGFYNKVGGYTIGQVFGQCDRDVTDPNVTQESVLFNDGTVVVKLAMTSLPVEDAPFLKDAFSWDIYADISTKGNVSPTVPQKGAIYKPSIAKVRLIQMDIILKDARLTQNTGTGWVFGTLVFDESVTDEEAMAAGWDGKDQSKKGLYKMVPLGAQTGNDPGVVVDATHSLKETFLNPHAPEYTKALLGWGGRLSGPIDGANGSNNSKNYKKDPYYKNALSSCMSCHGAAMYNIKDLDANDVVFGQPMLLPVPPNYPGFDVPENVKVAYMQNNPGSVVYCQDFNADSTAWKNTLGCRTTGPDWIGLDYDFVMFKGIYHAQKAGAKKERPKVKTFH